MGFRGNSWLCSAGHVMYSSSVVSTNHKIPHQLKFQSCFENVWSTTYWKTKQKICWTDFLADWRTYKYINARMYVHKVEVFDFRGTHRENTFEVLVICYKNWTLHVCNRYILYDNIEVVDEIHHSHRCFTMPL